MRPAHRLLLSCLRRRGAEPDPAVLPRGDEAVALGSLARDHGLAGPFSALLRRAGVPADELEFEPAVTIRRLAARSLLLAECQASLAADLSRAGVDAVAFKGPALECELYGPDEPRDHADIDLLVDEGGVDSAFDLLQGQGFVPALRVPTRRAAAFRRTHAAMTWTHPTIPPAVDLHWRIVMPRLGVRLDGRDLLARARVVRLAGRPVRVLSPGDNLLVLAVHGGKDRWRPLLRLADVVRLLERYPGLAGPAIFDRARRARCLRMLHVALLLAEAVAPGVVDGEALGRCRSDDAAVVLAPRLLESALAVEEGAGRWARLGASLELREHAADRLRMVAGTLFTPTPREWESGPVPSWLEPLYRPVRLAMGRGRA